MAREALRGGTRVPPLLLFAPSLFSGSCICPAASYLKAFALLYSSLSNVLSFTSIFSKVFSRLSLYITFHREHLPDPLLQPPCLILLGLLS